MVGGHTKFQNFASNITIYHYALNLIISILKLANPLKLNC